MTHRHFRRQSAGLALWAVLLAAPALAAPPRQPADLLLDAGERWIFTANEASGTVSMLEIGSGRVLHEVEIGAAARPRKLALAGTSGGDLVLGVSENHSHHVSIVRVRTGATNTGLELWKRIPVGRLPEGVLFAAEGARAVGDRLLVACAGPGEVWEVDVPTSSIVRRLAAVEGARHIACTPGKSASLVVAGRNELARIDLESGSRVLVKTPAAGTAFNLGGLALLGERAFVTHQVKPTEMAIDPQMIVWGLIIANRVTGVRLEASPPADTATGKAPETAAPATVYGVEVKRGAADVWIVPLDLRHRAAGDPEGIALVPSENLEPRARRLVVTSAGTDRLLVVDLAGRWFGDAEPLTSSFALPDVKVGARPRAVRCSKDGQRAFVACSLDDSIAVVDLGERRVSRTLRLAPPPAATPEYLGARVFFDADRSRGGWYSCHSCHPDGSTRGHRFDTASDGGGLAKKAPALAHVEETGPWSWRGGVRHLEEQIASSLQKTMAVDEQPSAADVGNVLAFLKTLTAPLPGGTGEEGAGDPLRGAAVFEAAGCERCHRPPTYTSPGLHDVGVTDAYDGVRRYNPPSLRGARDAFRYLHDGRAATLEAVFLEHNSSRTHGEAHRLSPDEMKDLMAFLRTL